MTQKGTPQAEKSRMSRFYRTMHRIFARAILRLYRVHIHYPEREPDGTYLLCSNHQHALDPFLLCAALQKQQAHFMGKKELFRIPLLGRLLRAFGAYPVDRSGDVGAIRTSISLLEQGKSVGVFPQGTRCRGKAPRQTADIVKNGAGLLCAKARVSVFPVCVKAKGNKIRMFHKTDLIFGNPISFEEMNVQEPAGHAEYARISSLIFEKICELYEEDLPQ